MGNDTVDAVVASATFESLMLKLGATAEPTSVAEYQKIDRDEMIATELEFHRAGLVGIAKWYGMAYEPPTLTKAGEDLLLSSWVHFVKRYAREMEASLRTPMPGYICI